MQAIYTSDGSCVICEGTKKCISCDGSGTNRFDEEFDCPTCDGTGKCVCCFDKHKIKPQGK